MEDAWEVHIVETDVQADGACHEQVVVFADNGTVGAVGLAFIYEVFVKTAFVALSVEMFADDLDEGGDDHWLGGDVGVEAVFARYALKYFVLGLTASIEVGIGSGDLVEDVL